MKISDLTEKGPIIGAPKGSQSDARLTPGTDDPSKYMRGGEWEAYREPQGVNSNAGKIAGGTKKGTTKTKNKKTSEGISDHANPMHKEVRKFKRDPDGELVKGNGYLNSTIEMARDSGNGELEDKLRDIRVAFSRHMHRGEYENAISMLNHAGSLRYRAMEGSVLPPGGPGASGDLVPRDPHATTIAMVKDTTAANIAKAPKLAGSEAPTKFVKKQVKKSLDNRPGNVSDINELFDYQTKMVPDPHGEGFVYDVDGTTWKAGVSGGGFFIVPWDKHSPTYADKNRTAGHALKAFSTGFNWLADEIKNGKVREPIDIVTTDKRLGRIFRKMGDRVAKITGWELKDWVTNPTGRVTSMKLAPSRTVESIATQISQIVNEAIPRVLPKEYSADYELRDDRDQNTIGVARINHGVIELLSVRNDIAEDFNGHVMSRLMNTIVRDADAANINLAIALDDPSDQQHKRFLERFGFRGVGKNIMKRNAGSVTPPSVPSVRL